jgi:timeless
VRKKDKGKEAQDTITKMKTAAADFDVNLYFARRLVSNHTVFMYTKLLSQYSSNSAQTNHRILAFLLRLSKFQIHVADPEAQQHHHPLAAKTVTLEPMLYNVQMLVVMDRILNDQIIRKDAKFESVLSFATSFVHRFGKAAEENPLLFVEALFKHPVPHRFCDLTTNIYVSEELRMLAERDLLLEEQRQLEAAGGDGEEGESGSERGGDDSEEELEFEDFGITAPLKPGAKKRRLGDRNVDRSKAKGKGTVFDDDSDEENVPPEDEPTEEQAKGKSQVFDNSSDEENEVPVRLSSCARPSGSNDSEGNKESGDPTPSMPGGQGSSKDLDSPKRSTFSGDSDSSDTHSSPKSVHGRNASRPTSADDGSDSDDNALPPTKSTRTERIASFNESQSESHTASKSKRSANSHSILSDSSDSDNDDGVGT